MKVAALVTGGKDSTLALYKVLEDGYIVDTLVSMIPRREDSWMFHFPNIHLTTLFSEAVEIPLIKAETTGIKEKELKDLKKVLSTLDVEGIVHGAISSKYQKKRIDKICSELKFKSISPLWQVDPITLLKEMINLNFRVIIVGVYAYGFNEKWLGKNINTKILHDLIKLYNKYQISIVGEGGEYETLVLDAPFFKKRIQVLQSEIFWQKQSGYLKITETKLIPKLTKLNMQVKK
jgi:ABC transporter with metal-binding/Fe-S-binding domain ATP-binding protein